MLKLTVTENVPNSGLYRKRFAATDSVFWGAVVAGDAARFAEDLVAARFFFALDLRFALLAFGFGFPAVAAPGFKLGYIVRSPTRPFGSFMKSLVFLISAM